MKRRAVDVESEPVVASGSLVERMRAAYDPTEPVPSYWVREPFSVYGSRAEQEGHYFAVRAHRRASAVMTGPRHRFGHARGAATPVEAVLERFGTA